MRGAFHEQLGGIGRDLSTMADLAAASLRGASVALLKADMTRPPEVKRGAETMDRLQQDLESRVLDLFAHRQPAADDLRLLVAALHMSTDLERMAELAVHLADIARRRHPRCAIPDRLSTLVARMAADSAELADGASHIIKGQDLETARGLETREDTVEELHRELLDRAARTGIRIRGPRHRRRRPRRPLLRTLRRPRRRDRPRTRVRARRRSRATRVDLRRCPRTPRTVAAARVVPGQRDLAGRDVLDEHVGDVRAGAEPRSGLRQDDRPRTGASPSGHTSEVSPGREEVLDGRARPGAPLRCRAGFRTFLRSRS